MKVQLAYGHHGLEVELPDQSVLLDSRPTPGLKDEVECLRQSMLNPIQDRPLPSKVKAGDQIVIVHSDITRATPNDRILPVLIELLESEGVNSQDITLLNALGTHRPQTDIELRKMLGDSIVDGYRCLQHDAYDDANLMQLGHTSSGSTLRINRAYMEADVRILTGFIEPHFFAGFSGGPKGILPAIAGVESVLTNHSVSMIMDQRATWGITEGNPIWEEMLEAAILAQPTFLLNVTLNEKREITGVFAGDLLAAHRAGCDFVKCRAMVPVEEPFDLVITTNSGYPLDQNLYQCVKGMSAARQIVKQGGTILMVAACADGLPEHGRYAELLSKAGSPRRVLEMINSPGFHAQDQWQVQIQAMIQEHAEVCVFSQGLTPDQIERALFTPCLDIGEMVRSRVGQLGRVAVLPQGPITIAYLEGSSI
jgi:nickel-dependent lactate racemase